MKKLLVLLALLSLMLAACGDKDKDDDDDNGDDNPTATTEIEGGDDATDGGDTGGGDVAANAEVALVGLLSGNFADVTGLFCDKDAEGLEAVAAGFPPAAEGTEYSADCTAEGDTVTCSTNLTVSGIVTPSGNYTFNVVDGKICDMQAAAQ